MKSNMIIHSPTMKTNMMNIKIWVSICVEKKKYRGWRVFC